jgi:hypothetical protein
MEKSIRSLMNATADEVAHRVVQLLEERDMVERIAQRVIETIDARYAGEQVPTTTPAQADDEDEGEGDEYVDSSLQGEDDDQEEEREAPWTVTFLKRGGKFGADQCYVVEYSKNVPYNNEDRAPIVKTRTPGLEGKTFTLGKRRMRVLKHGTAVMYDVLDVMDGPYLAHFTNYFGPHAHANNY